MPRTTVRIPTSLRSLTGGAAEIPVDAATVAGAIQTVATMHRSLEKHLIAPGGAIRSFVSVYLNDQDIRALRRGDTPLSEGDVVSIVPAVAGGSGAESGLPKDPSAALSREDLVRYSRHLLLPEVGLAGQRRLRKARVLVVGAGGLGSPTALYLAAAGIGTIGLVDFDRVDASNLQRQILYSAADVGRPKLEAAAERLEGLNPGVHVVGHESRLSSANALEIVEGYDVVIDGTDNFPTRYLVNDACVLLRKPNVYGSIYRFEGQASVFDATRGPCYRCLYPEPPPPDLVPSCAEAGVLGVLPGLIGTIQTTEALKLLLGTGEPLIGRLLLFDAMEMRFREVRLAKNPQCPICSEHPTLHGLIDYEAFCGVTKPADGAGGVDEITPEDLRAELNGPEPPLLIDVRDPEEWDISHIAGAHLIPRAQLPERVDELTRARALVLYCRSGQRSALATRTLRELGFDNVRSLRGGINAWAEAIDPDLVVY